MNINLKKNLKKALKNITKNKMVIFLLSCIIYLYVKLVGYTTKWEYRGLEALYDNWDKKQPMIMIGWHGRVLMLPFFWNTKRQNLHAIASEHQDGLLIAGVLKMFNVAVIGGSTNNNAKSAAIGLMRALKKGDSICILPDGPRGPRMRMIDSPIYFAQKTGVPIYGVNYSSSRSHIIEKAWDKMMIPLPFSRGVISISEPLYVPHDADAAELERCRLDLEQRINKMNFENDTAMNIKPVEPGHIDALRHGQIKED